MMNPRIESPRNSRRSLSRVVGIFRFLAEGEGTVSERADQQIPVMEGVAEFGFQILQVRRWHDYFAGGVAGGAGAPAGGVVEVAGAAAPAPPFNFTALLRSCAATALIDGCTSGVAFNLSSVQEPGQASLRNYMRLRGGPSSPDPAKPSPPIGTEWRHHRTSFGPSPPTRAPRKLAPCSSALPLPSLHRECQDEAWWRPLPDPWRSWRTSRRG